MNVSHINITPAFILSIVTAIVGQAVALIPSWAPYKQIILQIAAIIIPAAFLIANSIHAHATATATIPATAMQVVPATPPSSPVASKR